MALYHRGAAGRSQNNSQKFKGTLGKTKVQHGLTARSLDSAWGFDFGARRGVQAGRRRAAYLSFFAAPVAAAGSRGR